MASKAVAGFLTRARFTRHGAPKHAIRPRCGTQQIWLCGVLVRTAPVLASVSRWHGPPFGEPEVGFESRGFWRVHANP